MLRELILEGSRHPALLNRVAHSQVGRRASSRFMPGEELEEALAAASQLWAEGIPSVLTRLGEHVTGEAAALDAVSQYVGALEELDRRSLPADISIKPSQLGLGFAPDLCARHLDDLAVRADAGGRLVWIDMEESSTTGATLALFERAAARRPNLGLAIQANLHRTKEDLERLVSLRPRIRLVKGAYAESGDIAWHGKAAIDKAYLELAGDLLTWAAAGRAQPVFATHDGVLLDEIAKLAVALGAGPHSYEVHMLYGIRGDEQRRLRGEGVGLRVLISYGPDWAAWYLRRLAERPANLLLAASALINRGAAPGRDRSEEERGRDGSP